MIPRPLLEINLLENDCQNEAIFSSVFTVSPSIVIREPGCQLFSDVAWFFGGMELGGASCFPDNFYGVGTLYMDETTYSFGCCT